MTELIWDGKYDKDGKRVGPVRVALPFQTIETVNKSAEDRLRTRSLFAQGQQTEWRNRLIWGDKKYVLPSLLPEFAGKVDLIYIDPPFDTGSDFSLTATIPDHAETEEDEGASFVKEPSAIEQKVYRDTWGTGLDSYLAWFHDTTVLLRELLADEGSLYVHLDWHVVHYVKVILDGVFGYDSLRNEIVWRYRRWTADSRNYQRMHDVLLWYTKSTSYRFNPQFEAFSEKTVVAPYKRKVEGGRAVQDKTRLMDRDPENGVAMHDVWDIPYIHPVAKERTGYPTQKPEALLERVLVGHTDPGDLVADVFCGAGTAAAVAEKLGRRWIACDLSRFAIHTSRKRLLGIEGVKPFVVQNLGKYERQAWQEFEFADAEGRAALADTYRQFVLGLYHAEPVSGFTWLHGVRGDRMIHVGGVEAPVSYGDVQGIIRELWQAAGKSQDITTNGVDVLGWEFAFDPNETTRQLAAEHKIDLQFKQIPREVMDKKAVDAGDIQFFELGALDVDMEADGRQVTLTLKDFIIPPDELPNDVRSAIKHWSQWIDYWAVDWNYRDDTFHNEWQAYRTKKDPKITLSTRRRYEKAGSYVAVVKVIDILGNDTTKALSVEAR